MLERGRAISGVLTKRTQFLAAQRLTKVHASHRAKDKGRKSKIKPERASTRVVALGG
jgi:hypothetical protein